MNQIFSDLITEINYLRDEIVWFKNKNLTNFGIFQGRGVKYLIRKLITQQILRQKIITEPKILKSS